MSVSDTPALVPQVSHDEFREAMAGVCSPVSVITTIRGGRPHGTTVSAFASLSLDPPMVMVSLDRKSDLLDVIRETRTFGVNVLSAHQSETALTFARKGGHTKFDGIEWHELGGVPRLPDACSFIACDVMEFVEGGDHVVLFGLARLAKANANAPLTHYRRSFGTHRRPE